jgi:hypothetical protein
MPNNIGPAAGTAGAIPIPGSVTPATPGTTPQLGTTPQPTTLATPAKPGVTWDDIGAGAMGAGNGLLFGIPEFIYRRLGGEKDYQDFLQKHKTAYDVGNVAGAIGSTFIPVAGVLGKGVQGAELGAKALQGAKLLEGGAEAAKAAGGFSKIANMAAKGALTGGIEGGVRGVTGSDPGQELQGGIQGAQSGATWGGIAGTAGGLISQAAPKIAAIAKKGTEKAVLGTTEGKARQFIQMVQEMTPPGSGPGAKLVRSDALRGDLVDFIKSKKLWEEGAVEREYNRVSGEFNKFDQVYDSAAGNRPAKDVLAGLLDPEDTQFLAQKYQGNPEALKAAQDSILQDIGNVSGAAPIREQLKNIAEHARNAKVNPALPFADAQFNAARYDIAKTLRNNLDTSVMRVAEDSGIPIDPNFKRDWGFLQPLEKGALKADWTPATGGLGSNTFPKFAMGAILPGSMGVSGFVSGDNNQDIGTRLANAAAGTVLGYGLQKGLGRLGVKGAALMNTLANKAPGIAENLAENTGAVQTVSAGLGSLISPQSAAVPPGTATAGYAGGRTGAPTSAPGPIESDPVNMGRIENGLNMAWLQQTRGLYGPANESNQLYKRFHDSAMYALTDNGQSAQINPRLAANLMFQDPKQKEAYLKTIDAQEKLESAFPTAGRTMGLAGSVFGGIGHPEASAAHASIVKAVSDAAGGGKEVESAVNRILRGTGSQQEKFAKLMNIIKVANPQGAQAMALGGGNGV